MINKIRSSSLIRSTGIYTLSSFINAAIPFFLLPVLTRYLTPYDYGIVAMYSILLTFTGAFIGVNVHGAIGRQYFDKEDIDFPQYVTHGLYIFLVSSVITAFTFYILSDVVERFSEYPSGWLWAVWIVASGQFIIQTMLTLWQVQVKPLRYSILQISFSFTIAILSIWFIVFLSMNWEGRIQAQVIATSCFALVAAFLMWRSGFIKKGFRKDYLKNALSFGIPLIPHSIGGIIIVMTDRVLITNMVSISEMGIYAVGAQVGSVIGLLENSFNQAWVPWLFSQLKKNDPSIKLYIVKMTYLYFVLILFAAVALALLAPWFLNFFVGERFHEASRYVFWIALGWSFDGMYKMVTNYIFYEQKTHILAWVTFLTGIVNIVICYLLIKWNGALGAAQGTMIAFLFSFILTWLLSMKTYKMPWNLRVSVHAGR